MSPWSSGPGGHSVGAAGRLCPWCCFPLGRTPGRRSSGEYCGRSAHHGVWPESPIPRAVREMARLGRVLTVLPRPGHRPRGRSSSNGLGPVLTTLRLVVARRVGRGQHPPPIAWSRRLEPESTFYPSSQPGRGTAREAERSAGRSVYPPALSRWDSRIRVTPNALTGFTRRRRKHVGGASW